MFWKQWKYWQFNSLKNKKVIFNQLIYISYIFLYIYSTNWYIYIYFLVSQIETTISFSHETLKYLPETGLQRTKKKKKEKPTYVYICLCVIRVCICVCVWSVCVYVSVCDPCVCMCLCVIRVCVCVCVWSVCIRIKSVMFVIHQSVHWKVVQ